MIRDPGRILSSLSISRMSEYLSLCKIDCLVRKVEFSTPSRRVDQPSKVGQAGTMAKSHQRTRPSYRILINYDQKLGNRRFTLFLKNELSAYLGIDIKSLEEVGSITLRQGNADLLSVPLYSATSVATTLHQSAKKWTFCLAHNVQNNWVNVLLNYLARNRQGPDYLFDWRENQIQYRKIRKVEGGS